MSQSYIPDQHPDRAYDERGNPILPFSVLHNLWGCMQAVRQGSIPAIPTHPDIARACPLAHEGRRPAS